MGGAFARELAPLPPGRRSEHVEAAVLRAVAELTGGAPSEALGTSCIGPLHSGRVAAPALLPPSTLATSVIAHSSCLTSWKLKMPMHHRMAVREDQLGGPRPSTSAWR